MAEDKKGTYDVRLLCRNCNYDWIEKVKRGIYVRCEKDNNYMIERGESYKKRKFFTCPDCGAHKKIVRFPLRGYRG